MLILGLHTDESISSDGIKTARDAYLAERGITLLGGGMDESPQAYKDIESVIAAQDDLVDVIGKFTPRLVRMADEAGEY